jgi:ribulose-5-phosphate 4-epimerase/fuculose-1-phosphate aldolase
LVEDAAVDNRDRRSHIGAHVARPRDVQEDPVTQHATSAFAPHQSDLEYNLPPTFASVEAERQHRKERLAGALRIFGRLGFGEGVAGHITARDPGLADHFWVNPFGMSFRHVRVSDLILVNHHGVVVHGRRPVNKAAFVIHSAVHAARPDVVAAAHAHSLYGKAFSSLGRPLDPITQDACAFFEDHAVVSAGGGQVVLEAEGGRALAAGLGPHKAAIHQNHGLFTVGQSVDEAAWWFVTMERSCQAQLLAEAAGTPKRIAPEHARYTRNETGHALAGWFSFQPLWDEIVRTDPDLFE